VEQRAHTKIVSGDNDDLGEDPLWDIGTKPVMEIRGRFKDSWIFYIHLYSPYNMVAQANKTGTSKNTTNKKNNNFCIT